MTQCLPLPQGSRPGRREGAGTGAGGRRRPGQGRGVRREGGITWSKGVGRSFDMRNKVRDVQECLPCWPLPCSLASALCMLHSTVQCTVECIAVLLSEVQCNHSVNSAVQ